MEGISSRLEPLDLGGKVVAITGASRGLGAGIAHAAARSGASLALCSRSTPALAGSERVLSECVDVSCAEAIDGFGARAFERFGHVDLWINNAGLLDPIGPLRELDPLALRALVDTNVCGVLFGCRAYLRELHRANARGTLINVSSGAARNAYHGWSGYCATKAAVDRLSECIAIEESDRVRVYSLAPGVIDTDMQTLIRSKSPHEFAQVERFRTRHAEGGLEDPLATGAKILRFAFDERPAPRPVCGDLRDT